MGAPHRLGWLSRGGGRLSVVVLHEAYGLLSPRSNVPEICDRLTAEGFDALAPDLFAGAVAHDVDGALGLMRALTPEHAGQVVDDAVALFRGEGAAVAILGFCMGGALAFRTALKRDDLAGAVVFYGTPRGDPEALGVPVLGHFALRDRFLSVPEVREAETRLRKAGKAVAFHYYDGEHGFMNEKLDAHSAECSALAWTRTLGFLRRLVPGRGPA